MLSPVEYWMVLFAVAFYAFACGRQDERAAAITCIAATVGSVLLNSRFADRFSHVEYGVMSVDLLALVAFTAIALRTERFWPLWVAGLQLTTILAHVMKAVELNLMPQAYAAAARPGFSPFFLIIIAGPWRSPQRPRRERRMLTS